MIPMWDLKPIGFPFCPCYLGSWLGSREKARHVFSGGRRARLLALLCQDVGSANAPQTDSPAVVGWSLVAVVGAAT